MVTIFRKSCSDFELFTEDIDYYLKASNSPKPSVKQPFFAILTDA